MNHQILTFFIVSFFLVISPGPNMALIIDNATRLGRKNAFVNVLGLCTATYVHGAFSTPRCISAHSQQQNAVFFSKTHMWQLFIIHGL